MAGVDYIVVECFHHSKDIDYHGYLIPQSLTVKENVHYSS